MSQFTYRTFRNTDPPHILRLWNRCELGRGASMPSCTDAFETANYAQPYFDPLGLILAEEAGKVVGFVHAGFGFSKDKQSLDRSIGVICAVMVLPEFRRQGVGRELVRRAEEYLRQASATEIVAGQFSGCDPFYFSLYGGAKPCGFLASDPLAAPFFQSLGYQPGNTFGVYSRDLLECKDPFSMRLMSIRRRTELTLTDQPNQPTWWWYTHLGRFESVRFRLVDKKTKTPLAAVSIISLDHYTSKWNERAIGLVDMFVAESERGKGMGQALLIETVRNLRQDLIDRVEIHGPDDNPLALKALCGAGFCRIDTGTVYKKPSV
ncbi:MAG: GNAT family N-acetyltransferase [Planctomycetaceae bacterium]